MSLISTLQKQSEYKGMTAQLPDELFALSVMRIVYTVYSENFKTKTNSVPLQIPWTAECALHSSLASYVATRD